MQSKEIKAKAIVEKLENKKAIEYLNQLLTEKYKDLDLNKEDNIKQLVNDVHNAPSDTKLYAPGGVQS